MIKPAINYIYGLSPARMLWIYKQILLPRITNGSHVWGHSLTLEQQHTIRSLESLTEVLCSNLEDHAYCQC